MLLDNSEPKEQIISEACIDARALGRIIVGRADFAEELAQESRFDEALDVLVQIDAHSSKLEGYLSRIHNEGASE